MSEDLPTQLLDLAPRYVTLRLYRCSYSCLSFHREEITDVDAASATLLDEPGHTSLSFLSDDYAEEVMEALEDNVSMEMCRRRIKQGGELYDCWEMLMVLLQAAYLGCVEEKDERSTEVVSTST